MFKDNNQYLKQSELAQDLQFLLSSIRARENGLIYFLEKLKYLGSSHTTEFKLTRNQFLQKQKIFTKQINSTLQKHSDFGLGNLYSVRAFWIKLKTIIKVSVERITAFEISGLDKIFECYEKAYQAIIRCSDSEKSLIGYKQVENYLKKRNIQATLLSREKTSPSAVSFSESKIQKNRSQTLFKPQSAVSRFTMENHQSQLFNRGQTMTVIHKNRLDKVNRIHDLHNIQQENQLRNNEAQNMYPKIKSLNNKIKNRRPQNITKANIMNFIKVQHLGKIKSSKTSEKYIKKINRHIEKYQKNFQGVFDGKHDINLDKKKTIFENIYAVYDDLFAKNIPNHKMISKFMFNNTKINQIIYSAYQKKKRTTNKDNKEKKEKNPPKDKKQKEKQKQADPPKSIKNNRKIHSAKESNSENGQILSNIMSKQHYHNFKQRKQSQTTVNTKNLDKVDKKNMRSKTAKYKITEGNNVQSAFTIGSISIVSKLDNKSIKIVI